MYIYIYIYVYTYTCMHTYNMYVCVYTYIYIYIERERERRPAAEPGRLARRTRCPVAYPVALSPTWLPLPALLSSPPPLP